MQQHRIDPYYVWAETTKYQGMPCRDWRWVPLLVEAKGDGETTNLISALKHKLGEKNVLIPGGDLQVLRFTLHVAKDELKNAVDVLSAFDARWELSLPFASSDSIEGFDLDGFRPRSSKQIIGFIDYGCAFAHGQILAWKAGERTTGTRVLALWDQGGDTRSYRQSAIKAGRKPACWVPPGDFGYGAELRRDVDWLSQRWDTFETAPGKTLTAKGLPANDYIQQFVRNGRVDEEACYASSGYQAIQAPVTHGTFIMDVAAGYPSPLEPSDADPAPPPDQEIVFVQLPRFFSGQQVSGLLRTYVLDAVNYILSCAEDHVAVTINLSYGSYIGPHDGSSILELALDEVIEKRRTEKGGPTDIVIAAGNGADAQAHVSAGLNPRTSISLLWGNVPDNPTNQFIEIWLDGEDQAAPCAVRFTPPGAEPEEAHWVSRGGSRQLERDGKIISMVIAPTRVCQSDRGRMVLVAVAPTAGGGHAPYGDWLLEINNPGITVVTVNAWVERDDPVFMSGSGPRQARFQKKDAVATRTLNSLGHGTRTIVVGGYVGGSFRRPKYSSLGPGRGDEACRNPGRPDGDPKPGPEWVAICEESDALPGIAAAAVIGAERVRLPGTSVSAAAATRYVVEQRAIGSGTGPVEPPPTREIADGNGQVDMPTVPYSHT